MEHVIFATNSPKNFYEDQGIEQQVMVPYAHQTNGTAERAIRTIVTIGRSLLHHAKRGSVFLGGSGNDSDLHQESTTIIKDDNKTPFKIGCSPS